MKGTDDLINETRIQKPSVARSRLHYQPKSLSEILLTTVLSILVGMGILLITMIDAHQKRVGSQAQAKTSKQCVKFQSENLSTDRECDHIINHP